MKFNIIFFLIFISWNIEAQTKNGNQIKIEKNELGIGRSFKIEFRVLEPGIYSIHLAFRKF